MKQCTYFLGEKLDFSIKGYGKLETVTLTCEDGISLSWEGKENGTEYNISVRGIMESAGEHKVHIAINGIKTNVLLYGCVPLQQLIEKRCRFIMNHQQEKEGKLDGAYIIYDGETGKRFYSHLNDHNGGRERVVMGALLALWLQENTDLEVERSLNYYLEYVYRELFDENTGDVFNDIGRNADWDRLYNYPWMCNLFIEVYKWKKDRKYIIDAYKSLKRYYEKDGINFYAIGNDNLRL